LLVGTQKLVEPLLDWPARDQQEQQKKSRDPYGPPSSKPTQYPKRCGNPDCCGGREPMHFPACRAMQNHTSAQEADPRNDTLHNPAYGLRIVGYSKHGKRRSKSDEPKRSHSGRFVMQFPIETDRTAYQHRAAEANNDVHPADHAIISDTQPHATDTFSFKGHHLPKNATVPKR
jgi:hypothetical protein